VTESHKGSDSLLGAATKGGFNSHFAVVGRLGLIAINEDYEQIDIFDEIVIPQEAQIVPAFIVSLDQSNFSSFVTKWEKAHEKGNDV